MEHHPKIPLVYGGAVLAVVALIAAPGLSQQQAPPIARYTMNAGTTSGMAAMAQRGGMGGAMAMALGGGREQVAHQLDLRLGSSETPRGGEAKADHFMPAGAGLGKSVPLTTPVAGKGSPPQTGPVEMPKGRLLIYWGCGATAPKGQPVVIDFAKLAAGQSPQGLYMSAADVARGYEVLASNSRTYGDWENGRNNKSVPPSGSLIGAHRIAGNYSPEINFSLAQDFMPALSATASEQPGGALDLSWNSVAGATGYYAWVFAFNPGADGKPGDMVWWASSTTQAFGGPLWDWLPPSAVQQLIARKVVMPPSQTNCTVPAEVKQTASQVMMGNLYAYGPEADFVYPPRPADPKAVWKPDWIARVRYRSDTQWMLNAPAMGAMSEGARNDGPGTEPGNPQRKKNCRPGLGGLGGALAGAMGLGC